jgi:hypothetical protein
MLAAGRVGQSSAAAAGWAALNSAAANVTVADRKAEVFILFSLRTAIPFSFFVSIKEIDTPGGGRCQRPDH